LDPYSAATHNACRVILFVIFQIFLSTVLCHLLLLHCELLTCLFQNRQISAFRNNQFGFEARGGAPM
jgi:hypothetical protein